MSTNVLKFKDSLKDVKTFTRTAASANVINRTIAPLPVAGQFHPTDPTKDFGVMIADFQGALDAQGNPKRCPCACILCLDQYRSLEHYL